MTAPIYRLDLPDTWMFQDGAVRPMRDLTSAELVTIVTWLVLHGTTLFREHFRITNSPEIQASPECMYIWLFAQPTVRGVLAETERRGNVRLPKTVWKELCRVMRVMGHANPRSGEYQAPNIVTRGQTSAIQNLLTPEPPPVDPPWMTLTEPRRRITRLASDDDDPTVAAG